MSNDNEPPVSDKELWRRVAIERPPETGVTGSDANLIAALIEGTLNEDDKAVLEARMVASPVVRETVRAMRDNPDLGEPMMPPAGIAERAKAAFEAKPAPKARRRGAAGWLGIGMQWAATAASFALAAYVGFDLGRDTAVDAARTDALVRSELALDFDADDDTLVATMAAERRGGRLQ